jgi:hypothetical protein
VTQKTNFFKLQQKTSAKISSQTQIPYKKFPAKKNLRTQFCLFPRRIITWAHRKKCGRKLTAKRGTNDFLSHASSPSV